MSTARPNINPRPGSGPGGRPTQTTPQTAQGPGAGRAQPQPGRTQGQTAVQEHEVMRRPAGGELRGERTRATPVFRPAIDIYETPDELVVEADMPGVAPEDVEIQFENGRLTVHGRVHQRPGPRSSDQFLMREYDIGDFHRSFEVSEMIDPNRISAEMTNGVLAIHMPKSEAAKPRRIQVRPGEARRGGAQPAAVQTGAGRGAGQQGGGGSRQGGVGGEG